VIFELCVVGMRVTVWPLFTLLGWSCCLFVSYCVVLLDLSGSIVSESESKSDRLMFLSGVCLIGGCGLRKTHSGLSQAVSDSSTFALFFFGCDL